LQIHASIVEAIAETLSADADECLDDGGVKASRKYSLLVGQIKDAAAGVEQLRDLNVSHKLHFTLCCLLLSSACSLPCHSRLSSTLRSLLHTLTSFIFQSQLTSGKDQERKVAYTAQ